MIVTEETMKAAQEILDYIKKNPEKHEQRWFVSPRDSISEYNPRESGDITEERLCNTTMCIAGTAVFLEGGLPALNDVMFGRTQTSWEDEGARILGLDKNEAWEVFFEMDNEWALRILEQIALGSEEGFRATVEAAHRAEDERARLDEEDVDETLSV